MSLQDLTKEMTANRVSQQSTHQAVLELTDLFMKRFALEDRQRLKDLEALREAQKREKVAFNNASGSSSGQRGGGPFGGLLDKLKGLLGPLALGGLASLAGLDDALRAAALPRSIPKVKDFFKRLGNLFDRIGKIKMPELPKVRIIAPEEGLFRARTPDDARRPRIKIPELPKIKFIDTAGKAIGDFIDYKIKLPVLNFLDGASTKIKDFIDFKIKLPTLNFLDGAGNKIKDFIDFKIKLPAMELSEATMKRLPKIEIDMPKTGNMASMLEGVKNILGNFPDGATGVAGKGILGVIGSIYRVLKPVLEPIEFILKTALRPFTQIVLGLIDFVVGFYKGFTGEEGELGDKMLAGLEGGMLGIVKGITDAFDLLFITVPAFFLDKFGMSNMAEILRGFSLTDMVDPVWAGIKGMVVFVADNFMLMKDIIVADFQIAIKRISTGVKNAFERLSTFVANIGDNLYIMLSEKLQFRMPRIAIPTPFGEIVVTEGFSAGLGDETTRAAAAGRIAGRDAAAKVQIERRNRELGRMLADQQERLNQLNEAFQGQVVSAINDARTTNNSETTVLNAPAMPNTTDAPIAF